MKNWYEKLKERTRGVFGSYTAISAILTAVLVVTGAGITSYAADPVDIRSTGVIRYEDKVVIDTKDLKKLSTGIAELENSVNVTQDTLNNMSQNIQDASGFKLSLLEALADNGANVLIKSASDGADVDVSMAEGEPTRWKGEFSYSGFSSRADAALYFNSSSAQKAVKEVYNRGRADGWNNPAPIEFKTIIVNPGDHGFWIDASDSASYLKSTPRKFTAPDYAGYSMSVSGDHSGKYAVSKGAIYELESWSLTTSTEGGEAAITYTANWEEQTYDLYVDANGDGAYTGTSEVFEDLKYGETRTLVPGTSPTGKAFKGWTIVDGGGTGGGKVEGNVATMGYKTMKVKAEFEDKYRYTFAGLSGILSGGPSGTWPSERIYSTGNTVTVSVTDPTKKNYTFTGWKITGSANDSTIATGATSLTLTFGSSDITVTAMWGDETSDEVEYADSTTNVVYAMMIWDIYDSSSTRYSTSGLLLGPALGNSALVSSRPHTFSNKVQAIGSLASGSTTQIVPTKTAKGNDHRDFYEDSWATISYWAQTDPYVYENCLRKPIYAKSVPFNNLEGQGLATAGSTKYYSETYAGVGCTTLDLALDDAYQVYGSARSYANSTLRSTMGTLLNCLPVELQGHVKQVTIPANTACNISGADGTDSTPTVSLWALGCDEQHTSGDYSFRASTVNPLSNNVQWVAYNEAGTATAWWTRTPAGHGSGSPKIIKANGSEDNMDRTKAGGISPFFVFY